MKKPNQSDEAQVLYYEGPIYSSVISYGGDTLRTPSSLSSFYLPYPSITMDAIAKFSGCHRPLLHRIEYNRSFFSRPISSLSFPSPPSLPSLSRKLTVTVKATSQSPRPQLSTPQPLAPFPFSLLKTTVLAAATTLVTTALLFARFNLKVAIAAPALPTTSASEEKDESLDVKEEAYQEYIDENPNDALVLKHLMEVKVKKRKINEAIAIVERLIKLEPKEEEWPLLKAHMLFKNNEDELALKEFNEIASKDPLRSEAYHGLVMVASQLDSDKELISIEERIEEAIKMCEKAKKNNEARNLKLLIAQIRVIQGNFEGSLKIYRELVNEEPRDFRPYLCQGIIHTLMKNKVEAEEQFQKYKEFIPEDHPFADYFDENMMATKLFAQKVEKEERALTAKGMTR